MIGSQRAAADGTGRGVAEAIAGTPGHRQATATETVVADTASDAAPVAEGIGAGPRLADRAAAAETAAAEELRRGGCGEREGDRQSGAKNCKGFHNRVPLVQTPSH